MPYRGDKRAISAPLVMVCYIRPPCSAADFPGPALQTYKTNLCCGVTIQPGPYCPPSLQISPSGLHPFNLYLLKEVQKGRTTPANLVSSCACCLAVCGARRQSPGELLRLCLAVCGVILRCTGLDNLGICRSSPLQAAFSTPMSHTSKPNPGAQLPCAPPPAA